MTVGRGRWRGQPEDYLRGGIGLLVLDGLLVRRVGVDGRFGAELLGAGDLLRPTHAESVESMLPLTTAWQVLQTSRLAVLDQSTVRRMTRYPGLIGRLLERSMERSRRLGVNMAIVHHPRVDVRLWMLFWHLADRWGRIDRGQVVIPLRLTHTVLADLIAAQRPTVSAALADLGRRRLVCQLPEGWLLMERWPRDLALH